MLNTACSGEVSQRRLVALSFADNRHSRLRWLLEAGDDILFHRNVGFVWATFKRGLYQEMSVIWRFLKNIVSPEADYCE